MPPDALLYAAVLLACGAFGLAAPEKALAVYRVTRGRTPDSDSQSTAKVRVASGIPALVGLLTAALYLG